MTQAARMAREDAIRDALRAINDAIGDEEPTAQAFRIIEAVKDMRANAPVRVPIIHRNKHDGIAPPVDYLERVQQEARAAWQEAHGTAPGLSVAKPEYDATAGVTTPLGRLTATTWRTVWTGKNGQRIVWMTEYSLDGLPISVAEIRKAGLAQRPTSRNRKRKEDRI